MLEEIREEELRKLEHEDRLRQMIEQQELEDEEESKTYAELKY
ncbi:hypothetical protein AAGX49_14340 [Staphylococcus aureus]